jgi:glucose/arabinose dehydrogenase
MLNRRVVFFVASVAALAHVAALVAEEPPAEFACPYAGGEIVIDGEAKDEAWAEAVVIDRFYLPWLKENQRPARTATKAKLLWDRENLYFFAEMEDGDLYADVTEHDGRTWDNDVFELFFKPADDKPGYYEFQVNAAGTVMDMLIPRRNAGGYVRFVADGEFNIEAKVALRGTLNQWSDKDQGWSVEGRIPWRGFLRTGGRPEPGETWKFALCRYDYSVDFEGPELSTCAPLKSKPVPDFHHAEDYAKLKFLAPPRVGGKENAAVARLKEFVGTTPSRVVGSPEPPPPYRAVRVMPQRKLSWPIYVATEPGTRRLLFIDQQYSYGPARLCRTGDDPESHEFETLLEFPAGGVATSLCFHPKYAENGYLYVGWNGAPGGGEKRSMVTRYTIGREPPHNPDSATTVIEWPSDGHNGVAVAFGLDGMFYVTSGDGTSDSDTNVTGQGLDHLLAKLLRIDVDRPEAGREYSIPPDNPFVGEPNVRPETYAYGFRNPWRIAVDEQTGAIWVGNNGQDLWEQAYLVERGANYGWSVYEGSQLFYPNRKLGPTPVTKPTVEHSHSEFRSLTGGVVYYGEKLPDLRGAYVYGDYSTGKIWGAKVVDGKLAWNAELADTTLQISCFATDADGELLIADHRGNGEGGFYTLEANPSTTSHEDFPRTLGESGLFASVAEHRVHDGLIPYSVNSPLWSDGAHKERFICLPADDGKGAPAKIDHTATRGWSFPDRTVLVKSFSMEMEDGDAASRRWIETRFLTRQEGEWVGYSYAWNDEQTEAHLVGKEGLDRTFRICTPAGNREQTWRYPSRTECMVCHSRAANFVLGLSTLQMNKEHEHGGVAINQLELLESLGVLRVNAIAETHAALREELKKSASSEEEANKAFERLTATRDQRTIPATSLLLVRSPSKTPRMVDPYDAGQDLAARARSYLHANCSQCHVEAGGGNAQMDLEFATTLEKMKVLDVPPLHHKYGVEEARLVAPGDPERSILLHRISHRGEGRMPQLATTRVDEQAVELLRQWIEGLKP